MKYLLAIILYTLNTSISAQDVNTTFCAWFDGSENIVAQIQNDDFSVIEIQKNHLDKEKYGNSYNTKPPIYDYINIDNFFNFQNPSFMGNHDCEIAEARKMARKNQT